LFPSSTALTAIAGSWLSSASQRARKPIAPPRSGPTLLGKTVKGAPTSYSVDLTMALTETVSDGASACLHGNGRIGEEQAAGWVYHLSDVLGSVRQLVNPSGTVVMDRSFEPFGDVLSSTGTRTSNFQFTSQPTCASGGLRLKGTCPDPT